MISVVIPLLNEEKVVPELYQFGISVVDDCTSTIVSILLLGGQPSRPLFLVHKIYRAGSPL